MRSFGLQLEVPRLQYEHVLSKWRQLLPKLSAQVSKTVFEINYKYKRKKNICSNACIAIKVRLCEICCETKSLLYILL